MENKRTKTEEQRAESAQSTQGAEENASNQETKPACGCCGGKK
jgi:hypothetical protein